VGSWLLIAPVHDQEQGAATTAAHLVSAVGTAIVTGHRPV